MATQFSSGVVSIPTGVFSIPQSAVPGGTTSATLTLGRNTAATPTLWPNSTTTITLTLEVSYDGGATFIPGGGGTAEGGRATKNGIDRPSTIFAFGYSAQPTHIRGTVTIVGGPLVTSVTLTAQ